MLQQVFVPENLRRKGVGGWELLRGCNDVMGRKRLKLRITASCIISFSTCIFIQNNL
jgi:hypothetical protein